jgi:hypothetical protein
MLTCSGCSVARFCCADNQKIASKKAALGGNLWTGRHKDICGVLCKWRETVKDCVEPDTCTAELVAFLQRENDRCTTDAEGSPEQFSHEGGPGRRPDDLDLRSAERGSESVLE